MHSFQLYLYFLQRVGWKISYAAINTISQLDIIICIAQIHLLTTTSQYKFYGYTMINTIFGYWTLIVGDNIEQWFMLSLWQRIFKDSTIGGGGVC